MWSYDLADRTSPISDAPAVLASSYVATGYLRVYGFTVYSSRTSAQYILMFDASVLPANAAVPRMVFPVTASSVLAVNYGDMGRLFSRGIVLCTSSTDTSKTLGSADCFFDVEYDPLPPTSSYPSDAT